MSDYKFFKTILTSILTIVMLACSFTMPTRVHCEDNVTYEDCRICPPGNNYVKVTTTITPPTCTEYGKVKKVYECSCTHSSECNKTIETDGNAPTGHTQGTAKVENEKAATCTSPKTWNLVVRCTVCNAIISSTPDNDGKILPHTPSNTPVEENRVEATCSASGHYDEVYKCTVCNETTQTTTKTINIDPNAHKQAAATEDTTKRVEATCTEKGHYDLVVNCEYCEKELSRETKEIPIDENAHAPLNAVEENRVEATCIKDGSYDSVTYCERCHDELSRENKVITMLGHTPLDAVEENRVEAKCNEEGHYDSVVYCKTCKEQLSRSNVVIAKIPHGASELINQVGATMESEGYSGDTICSVCKEVLTKGSVVPKLTEDNINEDNVAELIDNDVELSDETKEALKELTEENKEVVLEIIDSTNKTMSTLDNALANGTITKEEYQEYVEKVEAIVETVIKAENQKADIEEKAKEIEEIVPDNLGIDLKDEVKEFYEKQLSLLLNKDGEFFDLEISLETYKQALEFIVDSIEKMEDAALMVKDCSSEAFVEAIELYISNMTSRTFKDFDKQKADEEFVEAAYNAILLNMQAQVLDSLTQNYNSALASGKYIGSALNELKENYQEEMANISDLESFEIMVTEVMRLKYVSKLGEKLNRGELSEADYLTLISSSKDVDTFMPIYKEIFKSWALNTENEYGMSLEELSNATLDYSSKNLIPEAYSGRMTRQDKAVVITVLGLGGINTSVYAIYNTMKKKRPRVMA